MYGGSHHALHSSLTHRTHTTTHLSRVLKSTEDIAEESLSARFLIACSFVSRSTLETAVMHFITGYQEGYSWERSINYILHVATNNLAETCWLRYKK